MDVNIWHNSELGMTLGTTLCPALQRPLSSTVFYQSHCQTPSSMKKAEIMNSLELVTFMVTWPIDLLYFPRTCKSRMPQWTVQEPQLWVIFWLWEVKIQKVFNFKFESTYSLLLELKSHCIVKKKKRPECQIRARLCTGSQEAFKSVNKRGAMWQHWPFQGPHDRPDSSVTKSNLTGWSDHKFLTGQVMVDSQTPDL